MSSLWPIELHVCVFVIDATKEAEVGKCTRRGSSRAEVDQELLVVWVVSARRHWELLEKLEALVFVPVEGQQCRRNWKGWYSWKWLFTLFFAWTHDFKRTPCWNVNDCFIEAGEVTILVRTIHKNLFVVLCFIRLNYLLFLFDNELGLLFLL